MVIKIKEILRLLRIIKFYSTNENSHRSYVQRSFNDEPVREADLPNYSEIERLCVDLGIIEINSDSLKITEIGKKIPDIDYEKISDKTRKILLDCFLDGKIGKKILGSLSLFNTEENGKKWCPKQDVYDLFDRPDLLPILYEIGLLEKKHTIIELNQNSTSMVIERMEKLQTTKEIRISQKQIDANLRIKKVIGNIAEKIALEHEKNRLKQCGFDKESNNVVLISQEYANAGYDICSFHGKSDNLEFDRYIEVKGSTGEEIDFFWSKNEIDEAKKRGDKYCIYFVPSIDIEKQNGGKIIIICNPIRDILENDQYDKQIESIHVKKINDFT
ncbi:MAG: DUF3883 domain-containing protein [Candidatus Nitrosotenuis sp.]